MQDEEGVAIIGKGRNHNQKHQLATYLLEMRTTSCFTSPRLYRREGNNSYLGPLCVFPRRCIRRIWFQTGSTWQRCSTVARHMRKFTSLLLLCYLWCREKSSIKLFCTLPIKRYFYPQTLAPAINQPKNQPNMHPHKPSARPPLPPQP